VLVFGFWRQSWTAAIKIQFKFKQMKSASFSSSLPLSLSLSLSQKLKIKNPSINILLPTLLFYLSDILKNI